MQSDGQPARSNAEERPPSQPQLPRTLQRTGRNAVPSRRNSLASPSTAITTRSHQAPSERRSQATSRPGIQPASSWTSTYCPIGSARTSGLSVPRRVRHRQRTELRPLPSHAANVALGYDNPVECAAAPLREKKAARLWHVHPRRPSHRLCQAKPSWPRSLPVGYNRPLHQRSSSRTASE